MKVEIIGGGSRQACPTCGSVVDRTPSLCPQCGTELVGGPLTGPAPAPAPLPNFGPQPAPAPLPNTGPQTYQPPRAVQIGPQPQQAPQATQSGPVVQAGHTYLLAFVAGPVATAPPISVAAAQATLDQAAPGIFKVGWATNAMIAQGQRRTTINATCLQSADLTGNTLFQLGGGLLSASVTETTSQGGGGGQPAAKAFGLYLGTYKPVVSQGPGGTPAPLSRWTNVSAAPFAVLPSYDDAMNLLAFWQGTAAPAVGTEGFFVQAIS